MSGFSSYWRKLGNSKALPDGLTKYYLSFSSALSLIWFLIDTYARSRLWVASMALCIVGTSSCFGT
jgi:hypothetical protein